MKEYRKVEAYNFSRLKKIEKSALEFKADVLHVKQSTLDKGSAIHCYVLEGPEVFQENYTFYPGKVRRGAEFEKFKSHNSKKTILSKSEYDLCVAASLAVLNHPEAKKLLDLPGESEAARFWKDEETGLPCKGQLDRVTKCKKVIELKKVAQIKPRDFARQCANLFYHAQAGMYCDGEGTDEHYFITVEEQFPHDVVVYKTTPETLDEGRKVYRSWLKRIKKIEETKEFPGIAENRVLDLNLPAWAFSEDESIEASENLEQIEVIDGGLDL